MMTFYEYIAVLVEAVDLLWMSGCPHPDPMTCERLDAIAYLLTEHAKAERPAPTCATCLFHGIERVEDQRQVCQHDDLDVWVPMPFGCSLHTPRPSTPEGSAG